MGRIATFYSLTSGNEPTNSASNLTGQLAVNVPDKKMSAVDGSGNFQQVASYTGEYRTTSQYLTGEPCLNGGKWYQANKTTGPGSFVVADWDEISGGGGTTDPAILRTVTTEAEGSMVLDGGSSATLTTFTVNARTAQTGDIVAFKDSAGTQRSGINPYGLPTGALGPTILTVNQVAHSFTLVGQAATWTGTSWTLALSNTESTLARGLVKEVIDANNVVIQTSGSITGLNPASFAGGAISPATVYYASPTVLGQLTSVAPSDPNIQNPMLYTLTSTTGIVLPWRPGTIGEDDQGPMILTVNQPAHGYLNSNIGAPLYYTGTLWELAKADSLDTLNIGVLLNIVSSDIIEIQFGGKIAGVSSAVNGGAPMTPGAFYGVSETTAGQIDIIDINDGTYTMPVYMAITGSEAVMLTYGPVNPTPMVLKSSSPGVTPLRVIGVSGQSANLFGVEDIDGGDEVFRVDNKGKVRVLSNGTGLTTFSIIGASGESEPLFGIDKTSGGGTVFSVNPDGNTIIDKQTGDGAAVLTLNSPASNIVGQLMRRDNINRWLMYIDLPESTGNQGSNLYFARYSDPGVTSNVVFQLNREFGDAVFSGRFVTLATDPATGATSNSFRIRKPPAGNFSSYFFENASGDDRAHIQLSYGDNALYIINRQDGFPTTPDPGAIIITSDGRIQFVVNDGAGNVIKQVSSAVTAGNDLTDKTYVDTATATTFATVQTDIDDSVDALQVLLEGVIDTKITDAALRPWESSGVAVPATGTMTTIPGPGFGTPLSWDMYLRCTVADLSFDIDDELPIPSYVSEQGTNAKGLFKFRRGDSFRCVGGANSVTEVVESGVNAGEIGNITPASWEIVVRGLFPAA